MFGNIFTKKLMLVGLVLVFIFIPALSYAKTDNEAVVMTMFSSLTCPHCNNAKAFIKELEQEAKLDFEFRDYTLAENISLAKEFYDDYEVPKSQQGLVPIIYIADRYFLGFNDDIGKEMKAYLTALNSSQNKDGELAGTAIENKKNIKLPWLGEINLRDFSLPVLAIVLGTIDGFNVCSLGALVLILGLVIALKSRKRIFILGFTFLLTTGLVYGVMILLWHQLFTVLAPYLRSLELVIGILSIIGGLYLLREFYKALKSGPICSTNNILSRLAPKVEKIFHNKTNWLVLIGVIVLFSGAVTIIEFPCSAVLPVLFSGVLVEAGVSQAAVFSYIALFILFYLLDEIIIFIIAVLTMKIKIVSPKFIIFFNLLAAFIFLGLGIFYLLGLSL